MAGNPYQVTAQLEKYRSPFMTVREDAIIHPNGQPGIYSVVESGPSVVIVPVDPRGNFQLVRLWRYPIDQWSWEFPAGGIDESEDPLTAAKRELVEETGLEAESWQKLSQIYPCSSVSNELVTVYAATNLRGQARPQDADIVETRAFATAEIEHMITSGEPCAGEMLAGLLLYQLRNTT